MARRRRPRKASRHTGFHPIARAKDRAKLDPPLAHIREDWAHAKLLVRIEFVANRTIRFVYYRREFAVIAAALAAGLVIGGWKGTGLIFVVIAAYRLIWWETHHSGAMSHRRQHRATRAWQAAYLSANPDTVTIPHLIAQIERPHCLELVVACPEDLDRAHLRKAADKLRNTYRHRTEFADHGNGSATLIVWYSDPLAVEPERPHLDVVEDGRIPFGVDRHGQPLFLRLFGNRIMFAGMPGSGKSTAFMSVLAYAFRLPHREVYLYDAKGGMDLRPWWPYALTVATDIPSALTMLDERLAAIHARSTELGQRGTSLVRISAERPLRIICLDEIGTLLNAARKEDRDRASYLIGEINRLGRATGDVVLAATQDLRSTEVSGAIMSRFTHILGLAVDDLTTCNSILGPGAAGNGFDISTVSLEHPGRGVWKTSEARMIWCRAYRIWGIKRYRDVRHLKRLHPVETPADSPPFAPPIAAERRAVSLADPQKAPETASDESVPPFTVRVPAEAELLAVSGQAFTTLSLATQVGCSERQARHALAKASWTPVAKTGRWTPPAHISQRVAS